MRSGALQGLLLLCLMACPCLAEAATIVVVKPPESDAALWEAFNRLRGELQVHGFEAIAVDNPGKSPPSADLMAALIDRHGATASVCLRRGSNQASADILLGDGAKGRNRLRTITVSTEKDASVLLAVRAVDLLRTISAEPSAAQVPLPERKESAPSIPAPEAAPRTGPAESPQTTRSEPPPPMPPSAKTVPTRPVPLPKSESPEEPARTPRPEAPPPSGAASEITEANGPEMPHSRFSLSAGLATALDLQLGLALGPSLAAHTAFSPRLGLSLAWVGPLFGQGAEESSASAKVRQEMLLLGGSLLAWQHGGLGQDVFLGAGALHLAVQGDGTQPWAGSSSATWVAVGQAGTMLAYRVLPWLRVEWSVGVLMFVPQPTLVVANRRFPMGDPSFLSSLSLRLDL